MDAVFCTARLDLGNVVLNAFLVIYVLAHCSTACLLSTN